MVEPVIFSLLYLYSNTMSNLPKPRHTKDSVQIIAMLLRINRPATIEEIAKHVMSHYNAKREDRDFWHTFHEKLSIGVNCGYIRKNSGIYTLVDPLPTVEEVLVESRNRVQE
ncbi:uncharacterized protein LOC111080908 [Drosophila obscura]|uniref:uncharacterized protein LOC111080908 n=1 Tax=Drosophila obscura TaxID=7282 RepID=UPI001BB2820E|nr:uncharacterized protein LOC111080908 [Drosophila obscura]